MSGGLRRRWRGIVATLALLGGLLAAGLLAAGQPREGLPLEPDSVAADGTRALVEMLEGLGADVVVGTAVPEAADTVLLLVDNLADERRADVLDRVEAGATLVLVDPASELAPEPVGQTGFGFLDTPLSRGCEVDALADVDRVSPGDAPTLAVPDDGVGCFVRGEGAWLVAEPRGQGTVVTTGGPRWMTNQSLGEADHARLAAALLAPERDATVAVLPPRLLAEGEGVDSPLELVSPGVWAAMVQLVIAAALLAWWRGRRLGEPVFEPQPVALPGSELTLALGELHASRGDAAYAGSVLRAHARRDLARRLGLPPDTEPDRLGEAARRAGAAADDVEVVLLAGLPDDDDGVLALARAAERVEAALAPEATAPPPGATAPPPDATTATETSPGAPPPGAARTADRGAPRA